MSPFPYILPVALLFVVAAYLRSVFHLVGYLRRFHTPTWVQLGQPAFPDIAEYRNNPWPFVRSGFLTMGFVFGTQFKALEDPQLDTLIWSVRVLLAIGMIGVIGSIILALAAAT